MRFLLLLTLLLKEFAVAKAVNETTNRQIESVNR